MTGNVIDRLITWREALAQDVQNHNLEAWDPLRLHHMTISPLYPRWPCSQSGVIIKATGCKTHGTDLYVSQASLHAAHAQRVRS